MKQEYLNRIMAELEKCTDCSLLDLILRLLIRTEETKKAAHPTTK